MKNSEISSYYIASSMIFEYLNLSFGYFFIVSNDIYQLRK